MAKGIILQSASFEPDEETRQEHLEAAVENAGFEVVPPAEDEAGEAPPHAVGQTPPARKSRKERAIERATAPLREKIQQLETGRPPQAEAVPVAQPKPHRAHFATDEAYEDALLAWGNEKWTAEKALKDAQSAQQRRDTQLLQNYGAQVRDAKSKYADWDKVINQEIFIGKETQVAILRRENGAEISYYLGRHPAYAAKLGEMDPCDAIMEIGVLSARLTGASSGEGYERPRPRVPAPVRTVSTGGSSSTNPTFAEIAARPNYAGKARDLKRAQAER